MEKTKAKKATTGAEAPVSGLTMGPIFGERQNVGGTPVQPEEKPEKPHDMPPDPCELRIHPQLGVVSYQMMKINYDRQVLAGTLEPYSQDALLIFWNSLEVYGQSPKDTPVSAAVGAAGGAGGGGGLPPHYPVTAGIGPVSPAEFLSPNYQNLMHYKSGDPGGGPPGGPGGGGGGGGGDNGGAASPEAAAGSGAEQFKDLNTMRFGEMYSL
ncbi:MAG: hypothetical protein QF919_17355, partial [Nitrospinota bacterium]|nr:hypothetical protein [Nitrospinota bacterium]